MTPMQWTAREGVKIFITQRARKVGSRLDTGTRLAIFRRIAEGQTQARIAIEMGVDTSTVRRIARTMDAE